MNANYLLKTTPSRIDFYATSRLPLDPRGDMQEGREELRHALKQLKPKTGHGLDASLTTLSNGGFDVENILFYNVGAANFRTVSWEGLAFRLHTARPNCPSPFAHHHHYELLPLEPPSFKPQLVFHLDHLNTNTKPHEVWWRARNGVRDNLPTSIGRFRLSITIEGLASTRGLSVIAKSLIDGIISAFHHDPNQLDPIVISRLAAALSVTAEQAGNALSDTTGTPLRPRTTLRAYRDFLKWYPEDDLCGLFHPVEAIQK